MLPQSKRFLRSLLVLPCLLGILAISPLFAQSFLQAGVTARTITTGHATIAYHGARAMPQMPGPPK